METRYRPFTTDDLIKRAALLDEQKRLRGENGDSSTEAFKQLVEESKYQAQIMPRYYPGGVNCSCCCGSPEKVTFAPIKTAPTKKKIGKDRKQESLKPIIAEISYPNDNYDNLEPLQKYRINVMNQALRKIIIDVGKITDEDSNDDKSEDDSDSDEPRLIIDTSR